MQLEKIDLPDTHSFSPFFLDYISGVSALRPFYGQLPRIENFEAQLELRSSFPESGRRLLVETLQRQYSGLTLAPSLQENISSLASKTSFTITTGHQLNIFTGPLYVIYKIATIINTCRSLAARYPGYSFIPVYWMASEDHDFEEISYFKLYGKKYTWSTSQSGAVGRFSLNGLEAILKELPGDTSVFKDAYTGSKNLSEAVRKYINSLFGEEGVVVIDADDSKLKKQLTGVIHSDLFEHKPHQLIEQDTEKLKSLGYSTQVNSREINFFWIDGDIRDRIETDHDGFNIVNQNIRITNEEMLRLIESSPEKFSPNVVLRPLYEEIILPNLAYVGGPSEVVYWLQLKNVFAHFNVPFPILLPRNFGMVLEHTVFRKFEKTGFALKDFFESANYLFNHYTLNASSHQLDLSDAIEDVRKIFITVRDRAGKIDKTLIPNTDARYKQTIQQLESIEKKMLRAEKRKHSEKLGQIAFIKDTLFPGGNLQERTDNFLNFYQQKPRFIKDLLNAFDPFDFRMHVLKYND